MLEEICFCLSVLAMSSIDPECKPLKETYDACFNSWYSEKFLKGQTTPGCEELLSKYKACVWKHIKAKNIDQLIADAKKDQTGSRGDI